MAYLIQHKFDRLFWMDGSTYQGRPFSAGWTHDYRQARSFETIEVAEYFALHQVKESPGQLQIVPRPVSRREFAVVA